MAYSVLFFYTNLLIQCHLTWVPSPMLLLLSTMLSPPHPPAPLTVYWVVKSRGSNTDCSLQILLWHLQPVGLWEGYLTSLCPCLQSASINCTWRKRLFWGLNTSIHVKHWTASRTSECTVMPAIINNSHLKALLIISFAHTIKVLLSHIPTPLYICTIFSTDLVLNYSPLRQEAIIHVFYPMVFFCVSNSSTIESKHKHRF